MFDEENRFHDAEIGDADEYHFLPIPITRKPSFLYQKIVPLKKSKEMSVVSKDICNQC